MSNEEVLKPDIDPDEHVCDEGSSGPLVLEIM